MVRFISILFLLTASLTAYSDEDFLKRSLRSLAAFDMDHQETREKMVEETMKDLELEDHETNEFESILENFYTKLTKQDATALFLMIGIWPAETLKDCLYFIHHHIKEDMSYLERLELLQDFTD